MLIWHMPQLPSNIKLQAQAEARDDFQCTGYLWVPQIPRTTVDFTCIAHTKFNPYRLSVLQKRRDKDEDVEISGLTEDAAGTSGGGEEAVSRGRSSGEESYGSN